MRNSHFTGLFERLIKEAAISSDYIYTVSTLNDDQTYQFLPTAVTDVFQGQTGQDITSTIDGLDPNTFNSTLKEQTFNCLQNVFYRGDFDFRTTPRCTVQSWFLLSFSIILIATIAAKFLAALQITKKRNPELQDKFVICQVGFILFSKYFTQNMTAQCTGALLYGRRRIPEEDYRLARQS